MADRRPVVIGANGRPEQLQVGDTLLADGNIQASAYLGAQLRLQDGSLTGAFNLIVQSGEVLTGARQFNIELGDVSRTLNLSGDVTITGDHTGVNGEAVLGAGFSCTGATGVFQDTGFSIALPSAGTYLVMCTLRNIVGSAVAVCYNQFKLFNSTTAADVANTSTIGAVARVVSTLEDDVTPINVVVTTTGAETLKVYMSRTFTTSTTAADMVTDLSKLLYIRLK